jgi:hypothetical protein
MGNVKRRKLNASPTLPTVKVPMIKYKINFGDPKDPLTIPKFLRRTEGPVHVLPKRLQELYAVGKLKEIVF